MARGLRSIGLNKISYGQISSQYISVTLEADTTATGVEHNPFDENNSSPSSFKTHVSKGISYTKENGRFTFTESGIYQVTLVLYINASTPTNFEPFGIRKNGTDYDINAAGVRVHSGVDPVERTMSYIGSFSKGEYIEFISDVVGGACSFVKGTTMSILRVG